MSRGIIILLSLLLTTLGALSNQAREPRSADATLAPSAPITDLFDAMTVGDVEARLIPQNSKTGTVILRNATDRPLTIRLPDEFAGVPVLAQRQGIGAQAGGAGGNGGNSGGNQGIGGAFGGGGLGGGLGGGGGLFNIGPDRVTKLKVVSVCLEHGKAEPHPRVSYELKPIAQLTSDPATVEVVRMLGHGEIDQPAAQAAAWHLANGLNWQQLAQMIGIKHINGQTEPYFTADQVVQAQRIAREALRRANVNVPVPDSLAATAH